MPTTQYLPFATAGGANTLSASSYAATGTLIGSGYVAGIADAMHVNTVLRQATVGVAGTAKFATDNGALNCMDDGSPTNFALALKSAVDALIRIAQPAGMVASFSMLTAPAGWLACDGSEVSRTTYAYLFTAIGNRHGSGNGTTTFNLPDLRGEFVRGWDSGRGVDPFRSLGDLQASALESHTHEINLQQLNSSGDVGSGKLATGGQSPEGTIPNIFSNATGGALETRPRNMALLYCIKT